MSSNLQPLHAVYNCVGLFSIVLSDLTIVCCTSSCPGSLHLPDDNFTGYYLCLSISVLVALNIKKNYLLSFPQHIVLAFYFNFFFVSRFSKENSV